LVLVELVLQLMVLVQMATQVFTEWYLLVVVRVHLH
jgi:hypothetical protein